MGAEGTRVQADVKRENQEDQGLTEEHMGQSVEAIKSE